jgi:RNA polymerase sigma-70 factor (ECF subfamily)
MKPTATNPVPSDADDEFEAMYGRHYHQVLAYCGRRLPFSEAADAAADTFLVAWRRFGEMPRGDAERPWLYGVAYRVVSNQRRSALRRGRLTERLKMTDSDTVDGPGLQVIRSETDREVMEALARLNEIDREVVLMSLWEEMSSPEVAEALGIKQAAVRKRLSRARRRLRKMLTPTESVAEVIPITEAQGEAQ